MRKSGRCSHLDWMHCMLALQHMLAWDRNSTTNRNKVQKINLLNIMISTIKENNFLNTFKCRENVLFRRLKGSFYLYCPTALCLSPQRTLSTVWGQCSVMQGSSAVQCRTWQYIVGRAVLLALSIDLIRYNMSNRGGRTEHQYCTVFYVYTGTQ